MLLIGSILSPAEIITLAVSVLFLPIGMYDITMGVKGIMEKAEHARAFIERGIVISMLCIFAVILPIF